MKASMILLLIILCFSVYSQETNTDIELPKEDSAALMDFQIGDAEVDFFITGSWELSLMGSFGLLFHPENGIQGLDGFDDFVPGIIFEQLPDITLSLWIMSMFFLDFTYRGDLEDNLFLVGYEGDGSIPLSHLYIGNREIILPPYPYMTLPEAGQSSLGIEAQFLTENTQHDLLLRYDNNDEESKVYSGSSELVESRLSPADYIQGRFFLLPDEDVESLVVLVQDPQGDITTETDNYKYRKVNFDDALVSSKTGEISFYEQIKGRILVYYEKDSLPVGTDNSLLGDKFLPNESSSYPGSIDVSLPPLRFYFDMPDYLGEDMNNRQIKIGSKDYLLIYEPNFFSPFQICSYYPLVGGDIGSTTASWVKKNSHEKINGSSWPSLQYQDEASRVRAYYTFDFREHPANRFPLYDSAEILYTQGLGKDDYPYDYELLVENSYPIDQYYIEADFIPGSVRIMRNGREEINFTVDDESGVIHFQFPPLPGDRIEIFYRKKTAALNQGDIIFGWGNSFTLDDWQKIKLAAGLRWNLLPGAYTDRGFARRGALLTSASYELNTPEHQLNISLGASLTNPDTTGVFRLAGMEKQNIVFYLADYPFYPASVPSVPSGLTVNNRGRLLYKNYRSVDFLGSSFLNPISWGDAIVSDYVDGQKSGPYLTAGSPEGETKGESLVLDFEMDSGQNWVAAQIPLPRGSDIWDLSMTQSIYFWYRSLEITANTGPYRMYLQIGEISEDLDGDGNLDKDTDEGGFKFKYYPQNIDLRLGTDPDNKDDFIFQSEDFDNNGILEGEKANLLLNIDDPALNLSNGDSAWQLYKLNLTLAQKKLLLRSRSIRIVIYDPTSAGGKGKLQINEIRLATSPVKGEILNHTGGSVHVREIPESYGVDTAPESLPQKFPEVINLFHNQGESQRILEAEWSGLTIPTESVKLSYYDLNPNQDINYKELNFFYRLPLLTSSGFEKIEFRLLDAQGRGLRFNWTPVQDNQWQKITVNLRDLTLSQNGNSLNGTVTRDPDDDQWLTLEVVISGSTAGRIYLDEFYQQEPGAQFGAAGDLSYQWSYMPEQADESFLKFKEIMVNQEAGFSTVGFSTLYGQPTEDFTFYSNTSISIRMLLSALTSRLMIQGQEENFSIKGGHDIKIPETADPVSVSNQFNYSPQPFAYDQNTKIDVSLKEFPDLFSIQSQYRYDQSRLSQNWTSLLQFKQDTWVQTNQFSLGRDLESNQLLKSYGEIWLDSFLASWPYESKDEIRRQFDSQINYILNPDPLGVFTSAQLTSESFDFTGDSFVQKSELIYSIGLPLELNLSALQSISIIPSYNRKIKVLFSKEDHGNFLEDSKNYFLDTFSQHYGYNQIPFYELADSGLREYFLNQSAQAQDSQYEPGMSIKFSRSTGSSLWDLLLASQVDFSIARRLNRQEDLYSFKRDYGISIGQQAINLFGRFGSHSFFSFYTLDDYSSQLSIALMEDEITQQWEQNYTWQGRAYFEKKNNGSLTLEASANWNLGEIQSSEITQSSIFLWQLYPEKPVVIPFLKKEDPSPYWIDNTETLKITSRDKDEKDKLHFFNLLLNHETALQFEDLGFLKVLIAIGIDLESYQDEDVISRLGFLGGIEMSLAF